MIRCIFSVAFSTDNGRELRSEMYGTRNYSMENYFTNFNSYVKHTGVFPKFTILKIHMT